MVEQLRDGRIAELYSPEELAQHLTDRDKDFSWQYESSEDVFIRMFKNLETEKNYIAGKFKKDFSID